LPPAVSPPIDPIAVARRVFEIEAEGLTALAGRIGPEFKQAVDLILASQGRVVVIGMGKSGLVGKKIAATLASTGTPSFFVHPAEASHGDLGMVVAGDVVVALSYSGETEELTRILPLLKRMSIPIIAMTGRMDSSLARHADIPLDTAVDREACPLGLAPTASTTATMALGDALAVALLEARGFKAEDFAKFHPGGSLGKRLLTRVSDLMHGGDQLPAVLDHAPLTDAILAMTRGKLGMTTVLDPQGKLAGVLTDGDLRRALDRGIDLHKASVGQVMGRHPKTITAERLAAEGLAIMQKYKITALVVAGEGGGVEGILHLHDLLDAGVV